MRQLRTMFCLFASVAAFLALLQHLGMNLWTCASCSYVNDLPVSALLAWGGFPALIGLTYSLYKEMKWSELALSLTSVASLLLIGWMVNSRSICLLCMLVHVGVLSARLCLVDEPKFPFTKVVGPVFFSLAVAFTATSGWDRFMSVGDIGIFRPRLNEVVPDGKTYVLFSDPECSRCHMVEGELAKLPNPPKLVYRWSLLPQSMYRSIRAATILEMARIKNPSNFDKLRVEILRIVPPLTDQALIDAGNKVGLGGKIKGWLDNPDERALIAIQDDQTTASELKIESLPALAELSAADVTGTRKLHQVPMTAIGLNP